MKILTQMPRHKVQVLKRNGVWQTVPGGFDSAERADAYGKKFYKPGQYRVVEGPVPKQQEA